MYSIEQKKKALVTYDRVRSVEKVIRELGYPTRRSLYLWLSQREKTSEGRSSPPATAQEPSSDCSYDKSGAVKATEQLGKVLHDLRIQLDILESIMSARCKEGLMEGLSIEEAIEVIDRLRDRYMLKDLLEALGIKRSTYHYQKSLKANSSSEIVHTQGDA